MQAMHLDVARDLLSSMLTNPSVDYRDPELANYAYAHAKLLLERVEAQEV